MRRFFSLACWLGAWTACGTAPAASPVVPADALGQPDTAAPADAAVDAEKRAQWAADANPPVPDAIAPPPACTSTYVFGDPPLPPPDGNIGIEPSGPMVAVGEAEKVYLYVILPGKSTLDTAADGPLQVQCGADCDVLAVQNAQKGKGAATVRFKAAGQRTITASFGDGRTGTSAVMAYQTALPVWRLDVDPQSLDAMLANPYDKTFRNCALTVGGQTHANAKVRLHGGSSADAVKRSFYVVLPSGDTLADGRKKIILRSEYIDKSLLRTALGYDAFGLATWLPVPNHQFVHLRVNQRFYGVANVVDHIDGDYLQARGRNPKGTLYEGDPPLQFASPGANFTPLFPADLYQQVYTKHSGPKDFGDLIQFIENVLLRTDAELFATLELYLKVRDWIEYAAMMAVIQNVEHIRKNWYMFRDQSAKDDRFEVLAWDLDVTWGHLWSEKYDVFDEAITTDSPPDKGSKKVDSVFYNQIYRVLDQPLWRKLWAQRVLALADVVLDDAFLKPRIAAYLCQMAPDIAADPRKRASNAEYLQRVDEITAFAKARRAFLHQKLGQP